MGAAATVLASPAGLLTNTPSFILLAQEASPTPSPAGERFTRGKKRLCQVSDLGAASREESHCAEDGNVTTLPAARSSRLRVSTHSLAGRCH